MATIVTRSGKGVSLTHNEVDANFTNLNTDKAEVSDVILATEKGAASGVAPLDATSKISSTYLPSYVDDVLEYANYAALPATGETGKIYVALDTNKTYRWSGSAYIYITSGAVDSVAGKTGVVTLDKTDVGLSNVSNTAQVTSVTGTSPIISSGGVTPSISISAATTTDAGSMSAADKAKIDAVTGTNTGDETASTIKTKLGITTLSGSNTGDQTIPTTLPASDVYAWAKAATKPTYTANDVGLNNVDNTTDALKPISTATQNALDLKAPLASPTFTGTVNTANLAYTGTLTGSTGILNIGSGQVYKDASGNVGINVTPAAGTNAKLQITGLATNATTLATAYSNATLVVVPKSTSGYSLAIASGTGDNPQLQVSANGAASGDLLIQPYGGNVGIGTSSPSSYGKFAVVGSNTGGAIVNYFSNSWTTATANTQVVLSLDPGGNGYGVRDCQIKAINNGSNQSSLAFYTSNATTPVEAMRIDSSGNVGIGTSSPTYKLSIVDQANNGFGFFESSDVEGPAFRCYRARGTTLSPTAVLSGDVLASLRGFGYTSAGAWGTRVGHIELNAAENFTATAQGSYITLATTPTGTTTQTERLRITSAGGVSFGSSGTAYGTSGQVLLSSGNAAPVWTNQSSIAAGSSASCTGNAATATTATNQSGGTVNATTGAFSGTTSFPSATGAFNIQNGTGDGASFTVYNTAIHSHWGIGFRDYQDLTTVKAYIDCRSGNIGTSGAFVGNVTGNISGSSGSCTGNAATATLATKASTLSQSGGNGTAMTFNWAGQGGQPNWLWGGNDGSNHYVYNPSNFSVNYATSSGSCTGNAATSSSCTGNAATATYAPLITGTGIGVSGTAIAFTGIPSWARRITILLSDVSTVAAGIPAIRAGSGSYEASGYDSVNNAIGTSTVGSSASATTSWDLQNSGGSANVYTGQIVITKVNGTLYTISGQVRYNSTSTALTVGFKQFAGTIDRVQLQMSTGTDTFNGGTMNIMWE